MKRLLIALAAALPLGCAGAGLALLLSEEARQDLVLNFEASVDAHQLLAEHVFALARGDVDISGYTYTPPAGDQPGTLTIPDGAFPFGTGSLTVNFTVAGDGGFVDPYDPSVDLSTHTNVSVVADYVFSGTSTRGRPMQSAGDFTLSTVQNGLDDVTATLDGTFAVSHDGYGLDLVASSVVMGFDLLAQQCTSVTGNVVGTVDIPGFFYDADFVVTGLGDQLQIGIDAVVETIDYVVLLSDL